MKQGLNQINVFVINSMAGETVPLSATSTSSSVTFHNVSSMNNYDVVVTNAGPNTAFINFGLASAGTVTATVPGTSGTTGATPILAGAIYTFQKQSDNQKADTCAAICASTETATLYFTSIQGS